ncbi:unnamed protein product, partial [Ectocarpus sp. 4 AP-2014]
QGKGGGLVVLSGCQTRHRRTGSCAKVPTEEERKPNLLFGGTPCRNSSRSKTREFEQPTTLHHHVARNGRWHPTRDPSIAWEHALRRLRSRQPSMGLRVLWVRFLPGVQRPAPRARSAHQLRPLDHDGLVVREADQDDARGGQPEADRLVPVARGHERPAHRQEVPLPRGRALPGQVQRKEENK